MDEISQAVAESVKSGQYFKDARRWYAERYLQPFSERSFLLIAAILMSLAAIIIALTSYQIFPIKKEIPFALGVTDMVDNFSVLKPLANKEETPQISLTKYLVQEYVRNHESYEFKNLEKQENRLKATSSKQLYKKFIAYMSTQNPESPQLIYQKHIVRTIEFVSTALHGNKLLPDKAVVIFKAIIENRLTKEKKVTTWEAQLDFSMPDIKEIYRNKEKQLDFIVTDYRTRPLN